MYSKRKLYLPTGPLRQAAKLHEDGRDPLPWPDTCPFSLDQLLTGDTDGPVEDVRNDQEVLRAYAGV